MLEVKNLTKIYKTKGGAAVNALDGVSVRFPEKGMVFLLGKSGSGKSTLLNVTGGLDSPTSGEIIVKGRSSKDFSQSDFDSYRNTFIGFIFQEYNILNEFTVEDNIALALELQGKPKDKKAIAELLEQVDLVGYAKRKPNTLSGGQKQRIAIARALIKSPEIIMADEPTGALDSATGKQVFDTLKKLSLEKLVIVVSHDREFAEQYGDRIIKLKDGKILSDVSKVNEKQNAVSENVTVVGESTICVKDGKRLTQTDFDYIKAFLAKTDGSVMIANGEKEISDFKKASRITDDGEKETFKETDENAFPKKAYTEADSKFIRSKLPARHAMKIGVSGLKSKPLRLFFTVLLCSVAFILFGMVSTLSLYNSDSTFRQTLKDSSLTSISLEKEYQTHVTYYYGGTSDSYKNTNYARFTKEEAAAYAETFGSDTFGAVAANVSINLQNTTSGYWVNRVNCFAYLPENNTLRQKISGNYPTANNEVVISTYVADMILECKIYDPSTGQPMELDTRQDIIGKTLSINGYSYKVTGLIDSGKLPEKYDALKDNANRSWKLESAFQAELSDGLHLILFVSESHIEASSVSNHRDKINDYRSLFFVMEKNSEGAYDFEKSYKHGYYSPVTDLSTSETTFLTAGKTSVSDGEAVISRVQLLLQLENAMNQKSDEYATNYYAAFNEMEAFEDQHQSVSGIYNWQYAAENDPSLFPNEDDEGYAVYLEWKTLYDRQASFQEKLHEISYGGTLRTLLNELNRGYKEIYNEETGFQQISLTANEIEEKANTLLDWMREENVSLSFAAKVLDAKNSVTTGEVREFTVVGVTGMYEVGTSSYEFCQWLSDGDFSYFWETQKPLLEHYEETTTKYREENGAIYSTIFLAYDHSDKATNELVNIRKNAKFDENDVRISLSNTLTENLEMVDDMVKSLSKVFLYIGLVLAVFAALLLSNFISVSISYKKKEIGILRAVGARSLDVFKIFFSESFVIAAICIVLSAIGSVILCNSLNAEVGASLGASLFVFGPLSILFLIGIALLTAFIATFLPVYLAARKKPVDSIRAL